MVPVIYTTYVVAMGHRPKLLARSGVCDGLERDQLAFAPCEKRFHERVQGSMPW